MTEDEVFDEAIKIGLAHGEVQHWLAEGSLSEDNLRNVARSARPAIVAAARREQRNAEQDDRLWSRGAKIIFTAVAYLGFAMGLFGLGFAYMTPLGWWKYVLMTPLVAAVGYLAIVTAPRYRGLRTRQTTLLKSIWRLTMVNDGVLPVFRAEINSVAVTRGTVLPSTDSKGLFGGTPLVAHQRTRAGERLAELVRSVNGGSFALAGPRGAGKTNLLRAFCAGVYAKVDQPADLTVFAAAPVEYVPREFLLHLYAETCRAVIARGGPSHLVKAAKAGLVSIAYVQTRSNELSGKYGFKGAELSLKRGVSLAGRAPTYPEVVNDFRAFVQALDRVVIAIDEIDRIGTGESARRFLNELKAIFDVPGCYYLVSVSTEAQHDFELSGMGLRTVFDSSFDEVVRVDYLDFDVARRLLGRLVIGLPEQFAALAFAFSGCLARQLIRAAREVLRQPEGAKLSEVARIMTQDELVRVCQTTSDALTALDDRQGVSTLLRALMERPDDLDAFSKRLEDFYDGESESVRELRDLAAARIKFLAVVREVFTDDLTEVLPDQISALAKARRLAGSNPATGLALLEEFSSAWTARPAPEQPPR
ncbi:hypothetical protein ACWGE0_34715 [Lentzea sp. NPDC054927]